MSDAILDFGRHLGFFYAGNNNCLKEYALCYNYVKLHVFITF